MKMKKVIFVCLVSLFCLFIINSSLFANSFTETFDNSSATSSYGDGSFIGVNGIEWHYVHCRDEGDFPIEGKGIMLRRPSDQSSLSASNIPGGIASFSVDTRKAFTGNTQRSLSLSINGDEIATFEPNYGDGADDTIHKFEVDNINISGNFSIELKLYGATSNQQMTLDNLTIVSFTAEPGVPLLPQIKTPVTNDEQYATKEYEPITIIGVAENAQKLSLYVNGIFAEELTLSDSTFSFTINAGDDTGLKLNEATLIEVVSDSAGAKSDTAHINVFVDTLPPVMTEENLLTEHEYDIPRITFNAFSDSTGIAFYNIYLDTNSNFTNYTFDTATTNEYIPAIVLTIDTWFIKITAVDNAGNISDTYYDTFVVVPFEVTIASVRAEGAGATVTARGIMTVDQNTVGQEFYIQDATAGLSVHNAPSNFEGVAGDEILVSGDLVIFNGLLQLSNPTNIEIITRGNNIPEPIVLTTAQAATADDKEGMLIRINNVTLDGQIPENSGTLTINDGSGDFNLRVDSRTDIGGKDTPIGSFSVIGILSNFNDLQIKPRSWDDFIFAPDSTPIILEPTRAATYTSIESTVTVAGTALQGDTIILYVDDVEKGILTEIPSDTWSFTISQADGLKMNDTALVQIVASDSEGNLSNRASIIIRLTDEIITVETFDNLDESTSNYVNGTFEGQDGSIWTYVQCRGDEPLDGKAIMLGRDRTPQSYLESGLIENGIGILSFDYMQAFGTNVNLNVFVNDELVGNVTTSGEQDIIKNSGEIEVFMMGDFKLKFINADNNDGQVVIDNITWSSYVDLRPPKPVIKSPVSDVTTYCTSATSFTISGDLRQGDTFHLLINDVEEENIPNSDTVWQYTLSDLTANDTTYIKLLSSDSEGVFSDTTIFNVFVDTESPELVGDLLSDTEYSKTFISFNAFTDNFGIYYYNISLDTDPDFTNPITDTTVRTGYRPPIELTEEVWYIKVSAVDFALNVSDDYVDSFVVVPLRVIPIIGLRENDAVGQPELLGTTVMVEGIVTVGTNRISTEWNQVFIQDATGGICILERNTPTITFNEGDSIIISGELSFYNGLTTIENFTADDIEVVASNQPLPAPVDITPLQLATQGENWEGRLVRLNGVNIVSGQWPGSGMAANLDVSDGAHNARVRIEAVTDIPGNFKPACDFAVSGVLSQFKASSPWTAGYQLVPKEYADFVPDTDVLDVYYVTTENKSGQDLLEELYSIINDHNRISYERVWDAFYITDSRNDTMVWDIYTDYGDGQGGTHNFILGVDQDQGFGGNAEGQFYNREHSFPTRWWGPGRQTIMPYTDLHHLYPVDKYINNQRSDHPFGIVEDPIEVYTNQSKLGPNAFPGYTGTVYEPINAYKGDLARTYFYMATRYFSEDGDWDPPAKSMFYGSTMKPWAQKLLLEWHMLDPVSQKEIDRNNAVYMIQGNRNPFIDNPDFAHLIWGYPFYEFVHNVSNDTTIIGNNFEIYIPANVTDESELEMRLEEIHDFPDRPEGYINVTKNIYQLDFKNASNTDLNNDVTITLYYDEDALFGESEDSVTVYYYDSETKTTVELSDDKYVLDTNENKVTITTDHVSLFGLFVPVTISRIADVRVIDEATGEPAFMGRLVAIEGIVTYIDGLSIYFQEDTSGGIVIFEPGTFPYNVGDKIRVRGTIGWHNQLVQIQDCVYAPISYANPLPEPIVLTVNDILDNGRLYEGMLARINDVLVVGGSFPASGAANVYVNDGSSEDDLILRIDSFSGRPTPEMEFNVIGVVSRFRNDFQVKPRSYDDIIIETDHGEFIISTDVPYTLDSLDNIKIDFPANVVDADELRISISENFQTVMISDTITSMGSFIDITLISPIVSQFNHPVTIHLKYKTEDLPQNANEDDLLLFKYYAEIDSYVLVPSSEYSIDKTNKYVSIETNRFHTYVIGIEIPPMDIIDIRLYDDGDVPTLINQNVVIEGIVTFILGREIYIQDDTAGIVVDDQNFPHRVGDRLLVRGTVGQFRGLLQIRDASYSVISSNNELPEPIVLTVNDIHTNGTRYEGMLARFERVVISGGGIPSSGSDNMWIEDESSSNDLTVRIDAATGISGNPTPTGRFTMIGVVSRYSGFDPPYEGGFQVKPRSYDDFIFMHNYGDFEISTASETTIILPDLQINFPANVIAYDTLNINISELFYHKPYAANFTAISPFFNIQVLSPAVDNFNELVTQIISYDPDLFPIGSSESDIKVFIYDISDETYTELDSDDYEINTQNKTVSYSSDTFQTIAVLVEASLSNIADIRENDANYIPKLIGERVLVEGVVTVKTGILGSRVYIQDTTAAIAVATSAIYNPGDYISVLGVISQVNGMTILEQTNIERISENYPLPEPKIITTSELDTNGEKYEGMLIMIRRTRVSSGNFPSEPGRWENMWIDDGSGRVAMRIESSNPDVGGNPTPTGIFNVRGIAAQHYVHGWGKPYNRGYQLLPREYADFIFRDVVAEQVITRAEPAIIEAEAVNISIPAEALAPSDSTATITVTELYADFPQLPSRTRPASVVTDFKVNDRDTYIFEKEITITIRYSMGILPVGARADNIRPYFYSVDIGEYIAIAEDKYTINTTNRTIEIRTNHFSIYTLLVEMEPVDIELAKLDSSGNGVPDMIDKYVMVEGIVTAGRGVFGTRTIFMQDETAGIGVFSASMPSSVSTGDKINVIGKLTRFKGLVQLSDVEIDVISSDTDLPEPKRISVSDYNNRAYKYQSMLVEMLSDNYISDTETRDNETITKLSQGGNVFEMFYYDSEHGPSLRDPNTLTGVWMIRGIFYHNDDIFWQLTDREDFIMPRSNDDFIPVEGVSADSVSIEILNRAFAPSLNETLDIKFAATENQLLEIKIFNVQGRYVKTVYSGSVTGEGTVSWDGKNSSGRMSNVGIYILYIEFGGQKIVKPISVAVPM